MYFTIVVHNIHIWSKDATCSIIHLKLFNVLQKSTSHIISIDLRIIQNNTYLKLNNNELKDSPEKDS